MTVAELPTIAIVTPSYQQARFLPEAIDSILGQGYPKLEYVVFDGGSSDGSLEVLRRYEDRLTAWRSEPDGGQYDAVNRAFAETSGEVMAWLNADDVYLPSALRAVGEIFAAFPDVEWVSGVYPVRWSRAGHAIGAEYVGGFSRPTFLRGANLPGCGWHARSFVQQESTFWRRSLWERAGGALDTSLALAADFDLWCRFFRHAEPVGVEALLGGFRLHPEQKTARELAAYLAEARECLLREDASPYGSAESLVRTAAWKTVGRRPLRRAPRRAIALMSRLSLLAPVTCCVSAEDGWKLVTDYVI